MERYIGLDAHSTTCTFAVMGPSGRRLKLQVLETNGKLLVEFLRSIPGDRYLALEEGAQSEWLYEVLEPHTKELVVVRGQGQGGPKSDSSDAWALADGYRTGKLSRPIYKAPKLYTGLRQAVRGYRVMTRDLACAKGRLKALFRSRAVPVDDTVYEPAGRSKYIRRLPLARGVFVPQAARRPSRSHARRGLLLRRGDESRRRDPALSRPGGSLALHRRHVGRRRGPADPRRSDRRLDRSRRPHRGQPLAGLCVRSGARPGDHCNERAAQRGRARARCPGL